MIRRNHRLARTLAVAAGAATACSASAQVAQTEARDAWRDNARRHASPERPTQAAGAPRPAPEFRSYDGSGNNPAHPAWGAAGAQYLRERSGAHYADGLNAPAGANRPGAREISNALADQHAVPSADERGLSTAMYEFGQFLDHDIGLAKGGFTEAFDIPVPAGDPWFDPSNTGAARIFFDRSAFDPSTGASAPRQQINTITSFIDASHIYGADAQRAAWLRTFSGGRMKVIRAESGDYLPFNDGTQANDDPLGQPPTSLVVAGDVRANEQPGLTTLHTVFLREHNFHADRLRRENPRWDDERLYQEARRIVAAEMQAITYNEFLPALLGRPLPPYRGYRTDVNPGLSNSFAAATYRIGHSMVGFDIGVINRDFKEVDSIDLAAAFFNPSVIPSVGGILPFVRYFAVDTMQRVDTLIVDPLRNFLFGPPGAGGFDLAALNIQRGRDHGLADYNTLRADLGLPRVRSFAEITSNPDLAARLRSLYSTVDNIDPWIGALAEDHIPGASVGPTHAAAITDQFLRLRDGDRFWYENNQFPPEALDRLRRTSLSDILARTTGVKRLQRNVFFSADLAAAPAPCPADVNRDGVRDFRDLVAFLRFYESGDLNADLNESGTITFADLVIFLSSFAEGC